MSRTIELRTKRLILRKEKVLEDIKNYEKAGEVIFSCFFEPSNSKLSIYHVQDDVRNVIF